MEELSFNSMEEILLYAINEEEGAYIFYGEQAKKTNKPELKSMLERLSMDELRHKDILSNLFRRLEKEGEENITFRNRDVTDYTPEYIPEREYSAMEEVIINAIQDENNTFFMYRYLASKMNHPKHKEIFQTLASEELKHRDDLLIELNGYTNTL